MGVTTSVVEVTEAEGWKELLNGEGVIQVQGANMMIKPAATLASGASDVGMFEKAKGNEVVNTDATVKFYGKVRSGSGVVAVWKAV